MLGKLLECFRGDKNIEETDALYYAAGLIALNSCSVLFINQYIMMAFHYGMKVRAACCSLVYRKVMLGGGCQPFPSV